MKKLIIAVLALAASFAAAQQSHAYVSYPWCVHGDARGLECVFTSKEQCAQDGRNRGFGGQCLANPFYKPNQGPVSGAASVKKRKPHQ